MSKGLEELSYIKENHLQLAKEKYRKLEPKMLEDVLTRKAKRYDIIEKELKALEIINKKEVDVALLKLSKNVERYNVQIEPTHLTIQYYVLTQEEWNLLKEVLS